MRVIVDIRLRSSWSELAQEFVYKSVQYQINGISRLFLLQYACEDSSGGKLPHSKNNCLCNYSIVTGYCSNALTMAADRPLSAALKWSLIELSTAG